MPLIALLAWAILSPVIQRPGTNAVELEFQVRAVALGRAELGVLQGDWRRRYWSMEALVRRMPGQLTSEEIGAARQSVHDSQPNVRASALAVYARHGLPLDPEMLACASDTMPEVRLQLARALRAQQSPDVLGVLARLARDADDRVQRVAQAQLFSKGESAQAGQLAFLQEHWVRLSPEQFLHLLDVIDRSNGNDGLLRLVGEWLRSLGEHGDATVDLEVKRALWFSLRRSAVDERAVKWLADMWLTGFPPGAGVASADRIESMRRQRLEAIVLQGPQRASLVQQLLNRAAHSERKELERCVAGAVSVHFAWKPGGQLADFPMSAAWNVGLQQEAWKACFGLANSWGPAALHVLNCPSPLVREAAWATLSETWARTAVLPPREWVELALGDRLLAQSTYRFLVRSEGEIEGLDLLYEWWADQGTNLRAELLRDHSPSRKYVPWRGALLDLWATGGPLQRNALSLLGAFEGDESLAENLLRSLQGDLRLLEAAPLPAKEVTRGPWREAESRARWQLETWMRVEGPGHVLPRKQLLLRVGKLGKELGKTLVADLLRSRAGCDALEQVVLAPGISSRVRYEILLSHPGLADRSLVDELFAAYGHCDEELQLRILERAGSVGGRLARELLLDVVGDSRQGSTRRVQAIHSLVSGAWAGPEVIPELSSFLEGTNDFELQQDLVRALGSVALDHRPLGFLERYDDGFQRSVLGDELLLAMIRIELRGGYLESTTERPSVEVLDRWRGLPGAAADFELRKRFEGETLAARNFAYGGWLQGAEALARHGLLESALGNRWWTWDGRLIMRLAETVDDTLGSESAELVAILEQAAFVALLGEGPSADRLGLMLRLRGRLLAHALDRKRWAEALLLVTEILDQWRARQVPNSTIERAFGPTAAERGVDPRTALLAIELECRVRLALGASDLPAVSALRPQVERLSRGPSKMARKRLARLMQRMGR